MSSRNGGVRPAKTGNTGARPGAKPGARRSTSAARRPPKETPSATAERLQREQNLPHEVTPREFAGMTQEQRVRGSMGLTEIDPYAAPNPHALANLYGEEKLAAALSRYSAAELRGAAHAVGATETGSANALIAAITQKVTSGRYAGALPKGETLAKVESAQRRAAAAAARERQREDAAARKARAAAKREARAAQKAAATPRTASGTRGGSAAKAKTPTARNATPAPTKAPPTEAAVNKASDRLFAAYRRVNGGDPYDTGARKEAESARKALEKLVGADRYMTILDQMARNTYTPHNS